VTDTRSIRLDPKIVDLSRVEPVGARPRIQRARLAAPFTRSVIQGSTNTSGPPSPQTLSGTVFDFGSWSDGGAATHSITAGQDGSLTATFSAR
jgi:hypothetical protein